MQDKKLSELLGIPELSDEEKELALKMKGILDSIDEETRIDQMCIRDRLYSLLIYIASCTSLIL